MYEHRIAYCIWSNNLSFYSFLSSLSQVEAGKELLAKRSTRGLSRKEPHEQLSELGNTHSATVFARDEQLPREAFLCSILVKTITNKFGFVIKSYFYCNGRIFKLGIMV